MRSIYLLLFSYFGMSNCNFKKKSKKAISRMDWLIDWLNEWRVILFLLAFLLYVKCIVKSTLIKWSIKQRNLSQIIPNY